MLMGTLNGRFGAGLLLRKGLLLIVLALFLALTPSRVFAPQFSIKIWTQKASYQVGESWTGVFWNPGAPCIMFRNANTKLTLDGPSTHMVDWISYGDVPKGSHLPSIGTPWVEANVGNWTATLSIEGVNGADRVRCLASGRMSFTVYV
jgi:hypothetical protein